MYFRRFPYRNIFLVAKIVDFKILITREKNVIMNSDGCEQTYSDNHFAIYTNIIILYT